MLRENLEQVLSLPKDAVDWLMMLFDAFQFFDDVADMDQPSRKELDKTLWDVFVAMPGNQFFAENKLTITPVVALAIQKWQASDKEEKSGNPSAMAFSWRASFYDIVLLVFTIVHGPSAATQHGNKIMALYGEKFEDYMKEFEKCQIQ